VALVTLLLAVFAYDAWKESQKSTAALEGQLNATLAGQRPWVDFAIAPKKDITFIRGGNLSADLAFTLINKGQMPAVALRIAAILVPSDFTGSKFLGRDYQAETCRIAETGGGPTKALDKKFGGFTIEEFDVQNVLFPEKNTDGSIIKTTHVGFNFLEPGDKYILKQPWPPEYFGGELIGCIAYHLNTLEQNWHHTKFDLQLGKKTGGFLVAFTIGVIASVDLAFSVDLASPLNDAD
jgi:hypothetical protein